MQLAEQIGKLLYVFVDLTLKGMKQEMWDPI